MDFEKIVNIFTQREPYYGILLSSMDRVQSDLTKTMAVGKSGNVFRLYYNKGFVDSIPVETALEIIKHECLHICLGHFTLWGDMKPDPATAKLRNIAEDIEVNCYLDKEKIISLDPALASLYGWEERLGAREYFKRLVDFNDRKLKKEKDAEDAKRQLRPGRSEEKREEEGSEPSKNADDEHQEKTSEENIPEWNPAVPKLSEAVSRMQEPLDDHSKWPGNEDDNEVENLRQQIEDLMVAAAEEVEKACGSVPLELERRLDDIRKAKKPKPVTDWRRRFRRYVGNEFSETVRKSKKRESKRFPGAAGNRRQRKSHILVAIDTSGSISLPEYKDFFGQIKTLKDHATFHVLECDAMIQKEYDFNGVIPDKIHGGGGTNFQPVIDYYLSHKRAYDSLVYFTDGFSEIPRNTPKETLWVISKDGSRKDRRRYLVNGASAVFIN